MKQLTEQEFNKMISDYNAMACFGKAEEASQLYPFRNCDLHGRDFTNANLKQSTFTHANLCGADFRKCDLRSAYFRGADLRGVDFTDARLDNATLTDALIDETTKGLPKLECPKTGAFIAYKKVFEIGTDRTLIAKLLIPEHAKRTSATSRKCRASEALPIEFLFIHGLKSDVTKVHSWYDTDFIYELDKPVIPKEEFNEDRWNDCSSGIHFFMTFEDAVHYNFN